MTPVQIKILQCLVVVAIYFIVKLSSYKIIDKTLKVKVIHKSRGLIIKKAVNFTLFLVMVVIIPSIWGVKQSDLVFFVGSVLTVIGIGLFAQWSLLSNITASLIIFFNHPIKLDDHITILEGKDYVLKGKVTNIGLFFVSIQTEEGQEMTLPNNVFIGKSILKMPPPRSEEVEG
jgi:small-conductance mechanosensitive channel